MISWVIPAVGGFLVGVSLRLGAALRHREVLPPPHVAPAASRSDSRSSPVAAPVPHQKAPTEAPTTTVRSGAAGGLLLRAIREDKHEPIQWVDLPVGDLIVTIARDAVAARVGESTLRLPVSYADTVEACHILGCVAPTKEIVDAAYEASTRDGRLVFHGLVRTKADTAKMMSLDFSERFNAGIERQLAQLPHGGVIAGPWKYWILHPRIVEMGAVNYGGFGADGKPIQTVGGRHDATHYDYSQLFQPVRREARTRDGRPVDLVEHFLSLGLPKAYVEAYR